MKETYLRLMELSLSAYSDAHIDAYFDSVKRDRLREHGFPRLTANIGILIAHGRRTDLYSRFVEMMDFCCASIPNGKAANDFSVREIVACLSEVEAARVVPEEKIEEWKALLRTIVPETCYDVYAKTPTDPVRNWALFTAVSEFYRQRYGLCNSEAFIDVQLASQLQWIDENGMYMDHSGTEIHQPMMYDLVPRGLFSLILHFGYRGKYYETIDAHLKKAALLTLRMQSVSGEIPFGGRSNQFLHNEAWMLCVYEYEANRYKREGNTALAGEFKAAVARAMALTEQWLHESPIRHIKNRFPTETKFGCERYAYFDKYMITTASNLYAAYQMCDDTIAAADSESTAPVAAETSEHFHKVFLKYGGYALEFDTNADPGYDACGLGRVHRRGAPSALCLSVPCPSKPKYVVDLAPRGLSICPGVYRDGEWHFATEVPWTCSALSEAQASVSFACVPYSEAAVESDYSLSEDGVRIAVRGDGTVGCMLPAFCFDGETSPVIAAEAQSLTVSYRGWVCRYETDGEIVDLGYKAANRHGHYRAFAAAGEDEIAVTVRILKEA